MYSLIGKTDLKIDGIVMRKTIIITIVVFFATLLSAVPADPRPVTVTQPNGKILTFYIKGDEFVHWCETLDGYTLLYNDNGNLEYACQLEDSTLVSSGILASNEEFRDEDDCNFLSSIAKHLFFSSSQVKAMRSKDN